MKFLRFIKPSIIKAFLTIILFILSIILLPIKTICEPCPGCGCEKYAGPLRIIGFDNYTFAYDLRTSMIIIIVFLILSYIISCVIEFFIKKYFLKQA